MRSFFYGHSFSVNFFQTLGHVRTPHKSHNINTLEYYQEIFMMMLIQSYNLLADITHCFKIYL